MQTRGFAPGCCENALSALCIFIGMGFQGPEARLIPAWRNALGLRAVPGTKG